MVNEHLSADEILWCEQLVQEIAAIVQEEKQNDQLSMQNDVGHVITLKYGDITVYVQSKKIDIQGGGSGIKSYDDGWLWTLLQENSVKDRLLEKGSEEWLSKVDAAKPKLQTLPPEVLETVMRCGCLYCKGMRMMATDIAKAESDADMEARSECVKVCACVTCAYHRGMRG